MVVLFIMPLLIIAIRAEGEAEGDVDLFQFSSKKPTPQNLEMTSFCSSGKHACAVFNSTYVKCWGSELSVGISGNAFAGLGDTPQEIGNGLPFIDVGKNLVTEKISCGGAHQCLQFTNKKVKCFGWNYFYNNGLPYTGFVVGSATNFVGEKLPFVDFGKDLEVLDVQAAFGHTCAILTGNRVKCLGQNCCGQAGQGISSFSYGGSTPSPIVTTFHLFSYGHLHQLM